jgi:hypothetical protein
MPAIHALDGGDRDAVNIPLEVSVVDGAVVIRSSGHRVVALTPTPRLKALSGYGSKPNGRPRRRPASKTGMPQHDLRL